MLGRISVIVCSLSLTACASMPSFSSERAADGAQRFQGGVGNAVTAPLEDLNIRRDEIPPILIAARRAPYSVEGLARCAPLRAEIQRLDYVLGPDVDMPAEAVPMENQAADAALSVVRDAASDLIPLRSWVRRLSGAHAHSLEVQQSIQAGIARRSFLKGVAHTRRCR